jgi:manganese efflux pump family protein
MSFLELLLISLGLAMDCFAVAISFGTTKKLTWRDILKMAVFFGFFQGLMPLIGWLFGSTLQEFISSFDHWLAFGILAFIGLRMIIQSFREEHKKQLVDIRKTHILVSLSFATSIDALMTGVSFGFIRVNIWEAIIIISGVTLLVTITGAKLSERTTFIPARWAELIGGLVLIAIGLKILIEHLYF